MDSFEFNKILASVLVALLVAMTGSLLSGVLINPKELGKNVVQIDVPEGHQEGAQKKPEVLEPVEPLLAAANVENGKHIFKKCEQCHTPGKGEPAKIGPNLWNIIGSHFAHMENFAYSTAMKEKQGQWTYKDLNHFLYKPRDFVPGTKMSFVGLQKVQDRADVIAYLRTLSDSPQPLPQK